MKTDIDSNNRKSAARKGVLAGLRVTLVTVSPDNRQSEARVRGLIEILTSRGIKVDLISHLPYSNRFEVERNKTGETARSVTLHFPARWPRLIKGFLVLAFNFAYTLKYSRKSQVVITSCGSMIVNAPVIVASRLLRKPLVYDWLDLEVERIPKGIFKCLIRQATTVLGLSYYLCEQARSYGCRDVVYAPCFVDVNRFQINEEAREKIRDSWGVGKDDVVIGYAGVLTEQEGIAVLLRAFKNLHTKHKRSRLAVMGMVIPTGQWVDVTQLTKDLHLEDTVIIVPPVTHSEVPNILSACDILCAPKLDTAVNRASIPIKVIEYLSMGLPTVTTPVGELPRIVSDRVNGFMAKPGDSEDLEAVLEKIIVSSERSWEIGRRGREEVAREFGMETVGNTIVHSLDTVTRK